MPFVSVTRARLRSVLHLPGFARAAVASLRQARSAEGFLEGSVLPDRRLTFWTLTVWTDEGAMRDYMLSGPHRAALPRFAEWCDEASVLNWTQEQATTPSWSVAADRMRREGRPSKVRRPSPDHLAMTFAPPRLTAAAAVAPTR